MTQGATRWALLGVLALLALAAVAWLAQRPVDSGRVVLASAGERPVSVQPEPGRPESAVQGSPEALPASADAAALVHWVNSRSVLRGTALDGHWGIDAAGSLQPSMGLRRRFDHVLQLQGQLSLAQISAYLGDLARHDLSPAQAEAVLQVWARYLQLQQASFTTVVRPDDPDSLAAALAERQQARRQYLGLDWAQAFYADEEAALTEQILRPATAAPAPDLIDRNALDPLAQQRLAAEEARQAVFARDLARAREAFAALQQAPELSQTQRQQARQAWLDARFDASEQARVRALLALPPS